MTKLTIITNIIFLILITIASPLQISNQSSFGHRIRITCIGDSITEGIVQNTTFIGSPPFQGEKYMADRGWNSYPRQLQDLLGTQNFDVLNYGKAGSTVQLIAPSPWGNPYIRTMQFKDSLVSNPDIVVIMLGTNDSKIGFWDIENYTKTYKRFIHTYEGLSTQPKIFIMIPPPLWNSAGFCKMMQHQIINEEFLTLIPKIAKDLSIPDDHLINLNKMFNELENSEKELFWDGCHPNREGYGKIAQKVMETIMASTAMQDIQSTPITTPQGFSIMPY